MKSFMPAGSKFTAHGMTWVCGQERTKNPQTAIAQKIQVWGSKKTWIRIVCRYDIRKEALVWEIGRYETATTRTGAASLAASRTREELDSYVDRLACYGDEVEKRSARAILKKKKHVNIEEHIQKNEEWVRW